MYSIIDFRKSEFKKAVLNSPQLAGKKAFARGHFSAVFEGSREDTVYKMTTDSVSYWLLNCSAAGVSGVHFPNLISDHSDIGEFEIDDEIFPIYLYEIERLLELKEKDENYYFAKIVQIKAKQVLHDRISPKRQVRRKDYCDLLPDSLDDAVKQLGNFAESYANAELDLHMGNFMQRQNGELVISDPFFDTKLYYIS